jgi:hypothetical protein
MQSESGNAFPWNLRGGDEVYWNDPDDGQCSRFIVIRTVEYIGPKGDLDSIIRIVGADMDVLECFAGELS